MKLPARRNARADAPATPAARHRRTPSRAGRAALLAGAVALALYGSAAQAGADATEPVNTRARPAVDPLGMHVSGFVLYPRLRLSTSLDDNVYANDAARAHDRIDQLQPQIEARSDWGRHALNLRASTTLSRYADHGSENRNDAELAADGRLDLGQHTSVSAALARVRAHERRDSPDDVRGLEPTRYDTSSADARFVHQAGKWSYALSAAWERYDYADTPAADSLIDNQDRDRDERSASMEVARALTSAMAVFVRATSDARDYDARVDDNGYARSSSGRRVVAGTSFDLSGTSSGEAYVGYEQRDYDDLRFATTHDLCFGANLRWSPSGLTTLSGVLARNTRETTQGSASGYLETYGALRADHELLRNLILTLDLHGSHETYRNSDRRDDVRGYAVAARYLANRELQLQLAYRGDHRDSNGTLDRGRDFHDRVVALELLVQR